MNTFFHHDSKKPFSPFFIILMLCSLVTTLTLLLISGQVGTKASSPNQQYVGTLIKSTRSNCYGYDLIKGNDQKDKHCFVSSTINVERYVGKRVRVTGTANTIGNINYITIDQIEDLAARNLEASSSAQAEINRAGMIKGEFPCGTASYCGVKNYQVTIYFPLSTNGGVNKTKAPYPLIVFLHGMGAQGEYYSWVGEELARKNYIVALPTRVDSLGTNLDEGVNAVKKTVDYMLQRNSSQNDGLFGTIDSGKIALGGHSLGAGTSLLFASTENLNRQIKAIIALSAGNNQQMMSGMFGVGTTSTRTRTSGSNNSMGNLENLFGNLNSDSATSGNFSDGITSGSEFTTGSFSGVRNIPGGSANLGNLNDMLSGITGGTNGMGNLSGMINAIMGRFGSSGGSTGGMSNFTGMFGRATTATSSGSTSGSASNNTTPAINEAFKRIEDSVAKSQTPILYQVGTEDGLTPPELTKDLFVKTATPKALAVIKGGNHIQFSSSGMLGDSVAGLIDKQATITREQQQSIALKYIVAWYDLYLKSNNGSAGILNNGAGDVPDVLTEYSYQK